MCQPATCPSCNKLSYQGCGQHLDSVFEGVASAEICHCDPAIVEFLEATQGA